MSAKSSLLCDHLGLVVLCRCTDGCHIALQMLLLLTLGCRCGTLRLMKLHFIHTEIRNVPSFFFLFRTRIPNIFFFIFSFNFEVETLSYTSKTRKEKTEVLTLSFRRKQVKFLSMIVGRTPRAPELQSTQDSL